MSKYISNLLKITKYSLIALLIVLLSTFYKGTIHKFDSVSNFLSNVNIDKYNEKLQVIDKMSSLIGIGLNLFLLIYTTLIILYVVLSFIIPFILILLANKAYSNRLKISPMPLIIIFISEIPGLIITINLLELLLILMEFNLVISHLMLMVILNFINVGYTLFILIKCINEYIKIKRINKNNKNNINVNSNNRFYF